MGFDFTVIVPLLPSHCGFSFVFGCGVLVMVNSSVFLSMIVQHLFNFHFEGKGGYSADSLVNLERIVKMHHLGSISS